MTTPSTNVQRPDENQGPIFVNGFSRGGTTILVNLLASHPKVCTAGEVHHAFKGHRLKDSTVQILGKCLFRDFPMMALTGQDFFSPRLVEPRKNVNRLAQSMIRHSLFREVKTAKHPSYNRFKADRVPYTDEEVRQSRTLGKNVDGMVFTSEVLAEMYPDATFFSLVRNGLAVCEGHLRRGRSAAESGRRYRQIVDYMTQLNQMKNHHILRFEDMLSDVSAWCQNLCLHAGLDPAEIGQLRMQARRMVDPSGKHVLQGGEQEWSLVWLEKDQIKDFFNPNVNQNQIQRLSDNDRQEFLAEAETAMQELGYDVDGSSDLQQSEQIMQLPQPEFPPTIPISFRIKAGHKKQAAAQVENLAGRRKAA